jgi:hypothetical protein
MCMCNGLCVGGCGCNLPSFYELLGDKCVGGALLSVNSIGGVGKTRQRINPSQPTETTQHPFTHTPLQSHQTTSNPTQSQGLQGGAYEGAGVRCPPLPARRHRGALLPLVAGWMDGVVRDGLDRWMGGWMNG